MFEHLSMGSASGLGDFGAEDDSSGLRGNGIEVLEGGSPLCDRPVEKREDESVSNVAGDRLIGRKCTAEFGFGLFDDSVPGSVTAALRTLLVAGAESPFGSRCAGSEHCRLAPLIHGPV